MAYNRKMIVIEFYIHFPYPEKNITFHVHVRVNVGRHPMEKARFFYLDEVILWLREGRPIQQFILERNPYFTDDFDILHNIPGITLRHQKNPYFISSSYINLKSGQKNIDKKIDTTTRADKDPNRLFYLSAKKTTEPPSLYEQQKKANKCISFCRNCIIL